MIALYAAAALAAPGEDLDLPDDLGLPSKASEDVPYRGHGLRVSGGAVLAQTPLSGDGALTIELRPTPGLRVDLSGSAWLGTAWAPRVDERLTVLIPGISAGVAYEAPTEGALRPWVGAGLGLLLVTSLPASVGPAPVARVGADLGRGALAWTWTAEVGALVSPTLPIVSGSRYRAASPVLSLRTGPAVRLGRPR